MTLPFKFRRAMALAVPIFSALALFGFLNGFAKLDENLAATGITLGFIIGILNLYLLWQNWKHLSP